MNKLDRVAPLFPLGNGGASETSEVITLGQNTAWSASISLDGAAAGDLQVQVANPVYIDADADAVPDNEQWVNLGAVVNATTAESELFVDGLANYYFVRIQYTATGGAGNLKGNIVVRGQY